MQISGAWSLGMDVLVRPCRRRGVLLEANAFGDYLPGLLCNGETTYETELREFITRRSCNQIGEPGGVSPMALTLVSAVPLTD